MKILFLIPARGGSKGIINKNIIDLCSKPLINYTIEECLKIQKFYNCEICISTDSKSIINIVEKLGLKVPFIRPEILSTDTASSEEVMLHALDWYQKNMNLIFDTIVLLQPTSPLRTCKHIVEAINLFQSYFNDNIDMLVSVKESKTNPYFNLFIENDDQLLIKTIDSKFTRRQDCPKVFQYNGAIYVINTLALKLKGFSNLNKIKKYLMDDFSSIDIDNQSDLDYCTFLLDNAKRQ
jgi:CMP-N,N'-diacetyllegionaminic acid synthase